MASEKPLFVPLKTEHFEAFERGDKDTEFRLYGPRWNERTCHVGRKVVLSHGYGKTKRLYGIVASFARRSAPTASEEWKNCFGLQEGDAACIRISQLSKHGR